MPFQQNMRIAIVTGVSRYKRIGKAICDELARKKIDIFFTYWLPYDRSMPWGVEDEEPERIKKELISKGSLGKHGNRFIKGRCG